MDSEKKMLGKKRLNDNIIQEEIENNCLNNEESKSNNDIIKDNSKIMSQFKDDLNLNQKNIKINALSLNESKNNSAFVKNNPFTFINPNISNPKQISIFSLGNNNSINTINKETDKNFTDNPYPIPNTQINTLSTPKSSSRKVSSQKNMSQNSENSESSLSQNEEDSPKNSNLKFKSQTQNTRNTAFGLKEISKRVMEIIKQSGQTTYRKISDQIVNELNEKSMKDEKNIRRRIYDSLNVMKSMKLFNKDKNTKTIMWDYNKELDPLDENKNESNENNKENKVNSADIAALKKEIKEKEKKLELLRKELIGLKNVLERNGKENDKVPEEQKLYFPFIVIEFPTNKDPKIKVALNEKQTKAHFGFDEVISMYGDLDAVSKIGNHPNFYNKNK